MLSSLRACAAFLLPFALATCASDPGEPLIHLTIEAAGEGSGMVMAAEGRIYCSLPSHTGVCDATLPAGSIGMVLTASAAEGSQFTGWRPASAAAPEGAVVLCNGSASPDCTIDIRGGTVVVVRPRFELPAIVAVSVLGDGSVTGPGELACAPGVPDPEHCRRSFALGTIVALAANGSSFNGWSVPCDTAGRICRLTAEAAQQIVAYFGADHPPVTTHILSIDISGIGSGSVRSADDGGATIDCSAVRGVDSGRCSARLPIGATVRLAVMADPSWILYGAGPGGCVAGFCTIVVDTDTRFIARFEPPTARLAVGVSKEMGIVGITSDPAGVSCAISAPGSSSCGAATFPYGGSVTLRAELSSGAVMTEDEHLWHSCGTGRVYCTTVVLTGDDSIPLTTATKQQRLSTTKVGDVAGGGLAYDVLPSGLSISFGGVFDVTGSIVYDLDSTSVVRIWVRLPDTLQLTEWGGACAGVDVTDPCIVTLDSDKEALIRVGVR